MMEQIRQIRDQQERIQTLTRSLAQCKSEIHSAKQAGERLEQTILKLSADLQALRVGIKKLEVQADGLRLDLKKVEAQRMSATDQKTEKMLSVRLETLKTDLSRLEDSWMEESTRLEIFEQESLRQKEAQKAFLAGRENMFQNLSLRQKEEQVELQELLQSHDDLFEGLPAEVFEASQQAQSRLGSNLVFFEIEEEYCPHCGMTINQRDYQDVRYKEVILPCSHCGALLFRGQ